MPIFFLYMNMKTAPRSATAPTGAAIAMAVVFACDESLELFSPPVLSALCRPGVIDADWTAAGDDVALTSVVGCATA